MIKNIFSLTAIAVLMAFNCYSQNNLAKRVSINAKEQPLQKVLNQLSKTGDFIFSYNSEILPKDTVITFKADSIMIQDALDTLLKGDFEYKEASNYIILRASPYRLTLIPEKSEAFGKKYIITGYVVDANSGNKIKDASIYEKQLLKSTLTNEDGYFKLKVKSNENAIRITVTKDKYREVTMTMLPSVVVSNDTSKYGYRANNGLEMTVFGKMFISSKQKIQNINLTGFFTQTPVQVSFVPGLSSHGIYNSQTVSDVSFNILGGYSAGVRGVEIGGLFNIDKYDVSSFQMAGLINIVGGGVKGVQIAGIGNTVLDSVKAIQTAGIFNVVGKKFIGVQTAGIINTVKGNVEGFQLAGILNVAAKKLDGAQVAGIGNTVVKSTKGLQLSGIYNSVGDTMKGVQVAGILNYAKKLKGLQIGLVNIADTLDGYSLGLINLSKNGYHKMEFFTNDIANFNLGFKSGNAKLHTSINGGLNFSGDEKLFTYGFGIGHDFLFNNKNLMLTTALSSNYLYLGDKNRTNIISKASLSFGIALNKNISLFTGPSYSIYYSDQTVGVKGYKKPSDLSGLFEHKFDNKLRGWVGWQFGINIF